MVRLIRELSWGVHVRVLVRAALALSLVLLVAQARASVHVLEEARPTVASAMDSRPMPAAFDCAPCARCYVAPAPATHGFSGDDQAPEERRWHVQLPPAFNEIFFDTGGRYVALPVRIAFCRWLD
jgi:hypothetical protein